MLDIGSKVLVTDQIPALQGIVEEVSTWRKLLGPALSTGICYKVRFESWKPYVRWISAIYVKPAD